MGCLRSEDRARKNDQEQKRQMATHSMRIEEHEKKSPIDKSLIKGNFVTHGGFLRAAAENDVYTLRVFFNYECAYAWDQYPADEDKDKEKLYSSHRDAIKDDPNKWGTEAKRHLALFQKKLKTSQQENALHLACGYGHYEASRLLIQMGFSPNAKDHNGFSAIHHAVCGGNIRVVEMLYKVMPKETFYEPANPTEMGRGETPFMIAVRLHRKKITKFFMHNLTIDYQQRNVDNLNVHGISLIEPRRGMVKITRRLTGEAKDQSELEQRKIIAPQSNSKSDIFKSQSSAAPIRLSSNNSCKEVKRSHSGSRKTVSQHSPSSSTSLSSKNGSNCSHRPLKAGSSFREGTLHVM